MKNILFSESNLLQTSIHFRGEIDQHEIIFKLELFYDYGFVKSRSGCVEEVWQHALPINLRVWFYVSILKGKGRRENSVM